MVAPVREFAVTGNTVQGIEGEVEKYRRFLLQSDRDVWLFYAAQIWSTDAALPILGEIPSATVIVPCGYSGLHVPAFKEYFRRLPNDLRNADALVYMSPNYQDFQNDACQGLSHLARIIPNGADETEFAELREQSEHNEGLVVLCVANHYPGKGHSSVIRAFREAAGPRDRLHLVGNKPPRRSLRSPWAWCRAVSTFDRRITLMPQLDREEIVTAYKEADLFLFGSYLECAPLVILEAMAAALPFVTTPVGNVRDYPECGLIVDRARLGKATAALMSDVALRHRLGNNGRVRWERHHRWSDIIDQYETLFTSLISA
jgi:glycosyltransferase involved in cell wall biosynthesis